MVASTARGAKDLATFLARNLTVSSEARPAAGDALVTAEGELVGLMLEDTPRTTAAL